MSGCGPVSAVYWHYYINAFHPLDDTLKLHGTVHPGPRGASPTGYLSACCEARNIDLSPTLKEVQPDDPKWRTVWTSFFEKC